MSTTESTRPWSIDLAHSGVNFSVRHMVISKVRGRFARFGGSLQLDEKNLTRSVLDIHIDASSIETGVADRDAHLKSPDFFDVERFPELTYRSRQVEKTGADTYRVLGDLTIHGTTREVALEVEAGGVGKDPWGNERAGFAARTRVDRKDFGLTWNKALETGGVLVGEHVEIEIEVEAVRAADQRAA
jgi:polyisoprenoid-binding protein YceI